MMPLSRVVLLGVLSILLLAAAGGWVWLGRSLPVLEGRLTVPGLQAPVEVARDRHGIPRIVATSAHDGYFALGYVHAQDRLWQMESQRRLGAGRLAELVGEAAVPTDRFMRVLGLYRLAEGSVAALSPEARAVFEAYADGVNAFLDSGRTLPPEFLALGHRPERWTPADSLVWGRLMAMRLSANWREELLRARVVGAAPAEAVRLLWPDYPADAPTTLDTAWDGAVGRLLAAMPAAIRPTLASNVWALDGRHTVSGKPLLVNDPHLPFEAPVLWYLARLEMPGLTLIGATVPGVPVHLLGHNGSAAWGITTTHGDTMDLFVEREATGGDGRAYQTPDGPLPFVTRDEVIRVKDGADVRVTVRATRHGPIVVEDPPTALSATALAEGDRTAEAIWRINQARSWPEFVDATRLFHTPQQNIAWAGADGTIGFAVAGRVPRRKSGDGTLPRPGWTGEFDWDGWVPFEELPRLVNPPSGRIVNANNKPVPEGYPHLLAADWPDPHRARRIGALLDRLKHRAGPDDMRAMLRDTLSPAAAELLPVLLAAPVSGDERARQARRMLAGWDGTMRRERPEPLIFQAWLAAAQRAVLAAEIGDLAASFPLARPSLLAAALPAHSDLVARALDEALDKLTARFGADLDSWRWGDAHRATFRHPLFGRVPWLAEWTGLSIESDGDDFTINRGSFETARGDDAFRHVHGPGFRAVYDLADPDRSLFAIATGQSGNILSPHWGDMLEDWRDGRMVTIPARRAAETVLHLEPPP